MQVEDRRGLIAERYRPLLELGRGGMARVYLAEDVGSGLTRRVVLKVLDPGLCDEVEMREAFRREAELGARLDHPNIVHVYEVYEHGAGLGMVMEYVEGATLGQIFKLAGPIPLRLHLSVLAQVLMALHHFHELHGEGGEPLRAVHRDVSPHNVMVTYEGFVKVLDFGIAKVTAEGDFDGTQTGAVKGKIRYLPQEQLLGDKTIDRRADLFAVGVMLWEAFAGRRMWSECGSTEIFEGLLSGKLPDLREACPSISERGAALVARATAHDRNDRFRTALEMQLELEECIAELGPPVHARELKAFMVAQLSEWRAQRLRAVEEARHNPSSEIPVLVSEHSHSKLIPVAAGRPSAAGPAMRRRAWLLAAISGVFIALVGIGLVVRRGARSTEPPPVAIARAVVSSEAAAQRVQVEIRAIPENAELWLDGERLEGNPWRGTREASPRRALVEARASGFAPVVREIALSADTVLELRLDPLPLPVASVTSLPTPPSATPPPAWRPSSRPAAKPVAPEGGAAPRAPIIASPACDPPYMISEDGVKTYKPECL